MRFPLAIALALLALLPASASARQSNVSPATGPSKSTVKRDVAFDDSVPKSVRRYYKRAISRAPSRFRSMNETIDGQLRVAMGSESFMNGAAGIATIRPDPERPYRIYLSKSIDWDEFQTSAVATHELGHIFDIAGVSGQAMRSVFLKQAKRSAKWKKCFKRPGDSSRCMPLSELFADQVAYYAVPGDFTSGYRIPRLFSEKQMGSILKKIWKPQATPGNIGGE